MRYLSIAALVIMLAWAPGGCAPAPKPIDYGTDACHFCRMTIVDRQHGAEIVTLKGKVYKFDAIECMVNAREELGAGNIAQYLCNTYDVPGVLTDATAASFLVSEALPSPMGANLTAFSGIGEAQKSAGQLGGKLYSWDALLSYLKSKDFVYHK